MIPTIHQSDHPDTSVYDIDMTVSENNSGTANIFFFIELWKEIFNHSELANLHVRNKYNGIDRKA